jgi:hypothetical protein
VAIFFGCSKTIAPGCQKWFPQIRIPHTPLLRSFEILPVILILKPVCASMRYHSKVLFHLLPVFVYSVEVIYAGWKLSVGL